MSRGILAPLYKIGHNIIVWFIPWNDRDQLFVYVITIYDFGGGWINSISLESAKVHIVLQVIWIRKSMFMSDCVLLLYAFQLFQIIETHWVMTMFVVTPLCFILIWGWTIILIFKLTLDLGDVQTVLWVFTAINNFLRYLR